MLIDEISELSHLISTDPLLVQGAGGNISWKDEDALWVKASGTSLADARKKNIFVKVDRKHIEKAIKENNFSVKPRLLEESEMRPSIETLLHALLPHKIVLHLHPVEILVYLSRNNAEQQIKGLLPKEINYLFIKYVKPGQELAQEIYGNFDFENKVNLIFLQSHGVILAGEDISSIQILLASLESSFSLKLKYSIKNKPAQSEITMKNNKTYKGIPEPHVQQLALNLELFSRLKRDWALFPDHVVFLGAVPSCYETLDEFLHSSDKINIPEKIIFIKDVGVFCSDDFNMTEMAQIIFYAQVLLRQDKNERLHTLTNEQINELVEWDAEKYRQKLQQTY